MEISVVIATRNRSQRLVALVKDLDRSSLPVREIIVVDASDEPIDTAALESLTAVPLLCVRSGPSVCIQRNLGIRLASAPWVAICDDDIEMPADYLLKLSAHLAEHPGCGAVSGLFLQQEAGSWTGRYDVRSSRELLLKAVFRLGIWGAIRCEGPGMLTGWLTAYFRRKGNHISRAGWPVITDFSGAWIEAPVYTLGAALVRRKWLLASPFDEVLDPNGIGDNYGVATGFPGAIHVLQAAFVYHHKEAANRLGKPLQYYRRALALDYFIRTRTPRLASRPWLIFSLFGNWLIFLATGERDMAIPAWKTFRRILAGRNPYLEAARNGIRTAEPML